MLAGFLGIFLLAGCGSSTPGTSASTSNLPSASLTATACAQLTRPALSARTVVGTLQSINGQTLLVKNLQGKTATVTYTSATRFTQQGSVPASSLKEGTPVVVLVRSTGSTYTATTITVSNGTNGFPRAGGTPGTGQFPRGGNNPCFNRGRFAGSGTATANGNSRGLVGTVTQVSGTTLTITDATNADYTVTITSQTRIEETKTVTASSLKAGIPLTVSGTVNSQGTIAARTVMILLQLPATSSSPQAAQQ